MFDDALSMTRYKNVFWQSSSESSAPYKAPVMEQVPDREILIATLSRQDRPLRMMEQCSNSSAPKTISELL